MGDITLSILLRNLAKQELQNFKNDLNTLNNGGIQPLVEGSSRLSASMAEIRAAVNRAALDYRRGVIDLKEFAQSLAFSRAEAIQLSDSLGTLSQEQAADFLAVMKNTEAAAGKAGIGLNSLRGPLTAVASHLAGVNGSAGNAASVLLQFAGGSTLALGVVAGVGAMAAAFHYLNREAEETADKADKAADHIRQLRATSSGKLLGEVDDIKAQVDALEALSNTLVVVDARTGETRRRGLDTDEAKKLADLKQQLADANTELGKMKESRAIAQLTEQFRQLQSDQAMGTAGTGAFGRLQSLRQEVVALQQTVLSADGKEALRTLALTLQGATAQGQSTRGLGDTATQLAMVRRAIDFIPFVQLQLNRNETTKENPFFRTGADAADEATMAREANKGGLSDAMKGVGGQTTVGASFSKTQTAVAAFNKEISSTRSILRDLVGQSFTETADGIIGIADALGQSIPGFHGVAKAAQAAAGIIAKVEGALAIEQGGVKVAQALFPFNPALMASGLGMIAHGFKLAAMGGGSGSSGGGSGGGGGAAAAAQQQQKLGEAGAGTMKVIMPRGAFLRSDEPGFQAFFADVARKSQGRNLIFEYR